MANATEIEREQDYFDSALDEREKRRASYLSYGAAAANKGAAAHLGAAGKRFADKLVDPDEAVAHSKFELADEAFYVGYNTIFGPQGDALVMSWLTPFARELQRATPDSPGDVLVKRMFETTKNVIDRISDLIYADVAANLEQLSEAARHGVDDALLRDLERGRSEEMSDIVRTIEAAQIELISYPVDRLLVVQGGPGTGKSAVALHRVPWLIQNDDIDPGDILVVGPTDTFTNYIRRVLPRLVEGDILQLSLRRLGPLRSDRRDEPLETARIKGQDRMAVLIERALQLRVRFPADAQFLQIGSNGPSLDRATVEAQLEALRPASSYSQGRQSMRAWLIRQVEQAALARNPRASVQVDLAAVDNTLERVWPQLTPQQFLQDLLGSAARLGDAAGDDFTAREVQRLYRQSAQRLALETWSDSDVALLDEAADRIGGDTPQYAHIVVDEAQDLSPMQMRSISRRSRTGSYTVVGDIAQSTGPWARETWDDLIQALQQDHAAAIEELAFGYRVPAEIYALAEKLLPLIAPGLTPPKVVRPAPEPPKLVRSEDEDDLFDDAVVAVQAHAGQGRFVGMVVAPEHVGRVTSALRAKDINFSNADEGQLGVSVNVVSAAEAKGLEFDAVVVVEPAAIAAIDNSGLRLLYIALTRATKYLTVVHARAFEPLGLDGSEDPTDENESYVESLFITQPAPPRPPTTPIQVAHSSTGHGKLSPLLKGAAAGIADQIKTGVSADAWAELLDEVRRQLGLDSD